MTHEYEDKEAETEQQQQQQQPPPVQQQQQQQQQPASSYTPPKSMGSDTQSAVADLLREIQSLRDQQAGVSSAVQSLQQAVSTYVSSSKRVTEDLAHIKTTQQSLTDAIDRLMNRAATKDDLNNAPSATANTVNELTRTVNNLKVWIEERQRDNTEWFGKQVNTITSTLNDVRTKLDFTKNQQSSLENQIRVNSQQVTKSIEESSSWGFWMYFFLFQVLFGVSFMWWKRLRDNEKKLL